ncbi:MAG TPA: Hsp20/alpha crystallin family protein [Longimicrobiales bacterium]
MLTRTGRTGWAAPLDALLDVHRELDRVFDGSAVSSWRPLATDVIETAEEVRVVMEVPGMDARELDLTIEDNVLRVSGEKRAEQAEEGAAWRLTERRYGRFERSFILPRDVRSDTVEASYDNGVLTVVLPKREEAKPRRVEIRNGTSTREIGDGAESSTR